MNENINNNDKLGKFLFGADRSKSLSNSIKNAITAGQSAVGGH